MSEPSIYQRLKAAGVPLESHESDLYAKVTPESRAIVVEYRGLPHTHAFIFRSEVDGQLWYEIPFANEPWWEARASEGRKR